MSAEITAQVEHAIALFARDGDAGRNQLLEAARSALPPIHHFGQILTDAWLVLQGDTGAATRFRDALDTIEAINPPTARDASRTEDLAEFFASEGREHVEELVENARTAPLLPGAVPLFHQALLMLAAFHSHPDAAAGARYAAIILGQMRQYDFLAALHRSALDALAGSDSARTSFRGMLSLLGGVPPTSVAPWPGPPIPHPPGPGPIKTTPPRFELPWPPFPTIDPCILIAIKTLRLSQNRYTITDVSPARACPGQSITINGTGFGDTPGKVRFRQRGTAKGSPPIEVAATTWTATQITVVVPPEAGGGIELAIPIPEWNVCGKILELLKQGEFKASFVGGSPDIQLFAVNSPGVIGASHIQPGDSLTITWKVAAADNVALQIYRDASAVLPAALLASKDPAPAEGTWLFTATNFNTTTKLRVKIVASGKCQPAVAERIIDVTVQKNFDLQIDGIEITQSIQYYHADRHLSDPADRGPDNGAALVADKAAYARVYVRSGQDPGFDNGNLPGVTGSLKVWRIVAGKPNLLATLNPIVPGSVTARANPGYAAERGTVTESLNFIIPANCMSGRLRLGAEVSSPAALVGGGPAYRTVEVDVTLRQTLQVAGIMVAYNGPPPLNVPPMTPNLVLPAPTVADLQATAGWTLAAYPVREAAAFRVAANITLTMPLTDLPLCLGCCSTNWNALMQALTNARTADGNQAGWAYYGLLPAGVPVGPVFGCGTPGLGCGANGDEDTMAHEIGHGVGLMHAPCGNVGTTADPLFPAYEPYDPPSTPTAHLGEYGLDIRNGAIHPPTQWDLMSYCGYGPPPQRWISLYNYAKLLNVAALSPTNLPAGMSAAVCGSALKSVEPQPVISLLGYAGPDNEVAVRTVARLVTRPVVPGGRPSEFFAELLDAEGKVLAAAPVFRLPLEAPGEEALGVPRASLLQAFVPDVAPGAVLRLLKARKVVWSRQAPAVPVVVREVRAAVDEDGRLRLAWEAAAANDADLETWVRWSGDGGETWHALTVGLVGREATLDLSSVPGGDMLFQVLVHDGFHTAVGVSQTVFVPHKPPVAAILYPHEGARVAAGRMIRLWGSATDENGQPLPAEASRWLLDDEPLAGGPDTFIEAPAPGRHTVTLQVKDPHGSTEAHRAFTVVEEPAPQAMP